MFESGLWVTTEGDRTADAVYKIVRAYSKALGFEIGAPFAASDGGN